MLQAKTSAAKSESSLVADRASVQDASESLAQQIGAPIHTPFATPADRAAAADAARHRRYAGDDRAKPTVPTSRAAREAVLAARYTRRGWNVELFPQVADLGADRAINSLPRSAVLEQAAARSRSACTDIIPLPCPVVPRGSFGFWSLQAVSTFTLPLVDYNARHSERVNDDAQLASAESTFELDAPAERTRRAPKLPRGQNGAGAGRVGESGSRYGVESARIAQLQYKAGVKTIYDVLQAQQAAQQAVKRRRRRTRELRRCRSSNCASRSEPTMPAAPSRT